DRARGGLMARYTGRGHLDLSTPEREVATCEFLADLIEEGVKYAGRGKPTGPGRPVGRPPHPKKLKALVRRLHNPFAPWKDVIDQMNKQCPRGDGESWTQDQLRKMVAPKQ